MRKNTIGLAVVTALLIALVGWLLLSQSARRLAPPPNDDAEGRQSVPVTSLSGTHPDSAGNHMRSAVAGDSVSNQAAGPSHVQFRVTGPFPPLVGLEFYAFTLPQDSASASIPTPTRLDVLDHWFNRDELMGTLSMGMQDELPSDYLVMWGPNIRPSGARIVEGQAHFDVLSLERLSLRHINLDPELVGQILLQMRMPRRPQEITERTELGAREWVMEWHLSESGTSPARRTDSVYYGKVIIADLSNLLPLPNLSEQKHIVLDYYWAEQGIQDGQPRSFVLSKRIPRSPDEDHTIDLSSLTRTVIRIQVEGSASLGGCRYELRPFAGMIVNTTRGQVPNEGVTESLEFPCLLVSGPSATADDDQGSVDFDLEDCAVIVVNGIRESRTRLNLMYGLTRADARTLVCQVAFPRTRTVSIGLSSKLTHNAKVVIAGVDRRYGMTFEIREGAEAIQILGVPEVAGTIEIFVGTREVEKLGPIPIPAGGDALVRLDSGE